MPLANTHTASRHAAWRSTVGRPRALRSVAYANTSRRLLLSGIVAAQGGGRESWDVGRFLRTVLFFNPLPTPQSLVDSFGSRLRPQQATSVDSGSSEGWVLVTGATGGVGKRIVEQLLLQGQKVRALVRNPGKAQELLGRLPTSPGASLEIVTGDITQAQTLQSRYFKGVQAVISATAATIAPKEGDTPDRQKYKQGIKFYEPEVVGTSPEAIEFQGIQNLLDAAKQNGSLGNSIRIFDPSNKCPAEEWGPLDDVVMGGVSQSKFSRTGSGSEATFSGRVSSSNSGGFASVRTRNFEPALNLGSCDALRLRVKGDSLRYKVTIRTDTFWDGVGYTQSFDTKAGEWQDVDLPFKEFVPVFRAESKPDAAPFNPSNVVSIQLMLSKFEYDGKLNPNFRLGDFSLPVASISAVSSKIPQVPSFVHVSSAGVTRPTRPGIDLEKEPPAVRMNDDLGGLLTWKLAGEDAIRSSGLPFAVVRPVALTEEPAGADLEIAQGDNIKGKISREEIAALCVALLGSSSALNTTFEIRSKVPFSEPFQIPDAANPPAPRNWAAFLDSAKLKQEITGKTESSAKDSTPKKMVAAR